MHEVQEHILLRVAQERVARYRDLKPEHLEGNIFTYHLNALIKTGYLEKDNRTYTLTAQGLRAIDAFSSSTSRPRIQPKIVTLLAVQNPEKQWLFYRREQEPFHGCIGFPYGKIYLQESVSQAAARELKERTGLTIPLHNAAVAYIATLQDGDVISHMLVHLYVGQTSDQSIALSDDLFFYEGDLAECTEPLIPGVREMAELATQALNSPTRDPRAVFYDEFVFEV